MTHSFGKLLGLFFSFEGIWLCKSSHKVAQEYVLTNHEHELQFSLSGMSDSLRPHEPQHARPPCPSPTPESTQIHVHCVGDAIQPSHPLSSASPPAPNLFQHQGLFKWVSSSIRWPKYWSFSFNISPSNQHPGLVSFRMDWLDLLAVQGTLKNLLQYHSSRASILQHSTFFIVQLSYPYMTTGETIASIVSLYYN